MPESSEIDRSKLLKKGMNLTTIDSFKKIVKKDLHRSIIINGFFEDTLPNFKLPNEDRVALAYIDCDYYDSTRQVLDFLNNYLSHGLIICSDYYDCYYADPLRGQRLAFKQFQDQVEKNFSFVEHLKNFKWGAVINSFRKSKNG